MKRLLGVSTVSVFLGSFCLTAHEQAQGTARLPPDPQVGLTRKPEIQRIRTQEEFNIVLKKDRAIVFFWVRWSPVARKAEKLLRQSLQERCPLATVYRVDPDDQPYVRQWLADQRKDYLGFLGNGEVAWVRRGVIVADSWEVADGRCSLPGDLERQTRQAFSNAP